MRYMIQYILGDKILENQEFDNAIEATKEAFRAHHENQIRLRMHSLGAEYAEIKTFIEESHNGFYTPCIVQ